MPSNNAMLSMMLKYQENLNDVFDPAWRTNRHSYLRAAAVECAELVDDYRHDGFRSAMVECSKLIEHWGYKWWKKPGKNEGALRIHLDQLLTELRSTFSSDEALKLSWEDETPVIDFDGTIYTLSSMTALEMMDLMMGICAQSRISWPLLRAIWSQVVPGELVFSLALDHIPEYKAGSKAPVDIKQMMLEVVDMIHFLMSEIARSENEPEAARATLISLWADKSSTINFDGKTFVFDEIDSFERMDLMIALCCGGKVNFELYRRIMDDVGLSFASLYRMYAAKNVLNLFRQHNGDKQGTYVKIWNGQEDNVYLAELVETWTEEEGMDMLYARLKNCYAEFSGSPYLAKQP